MISNQQSTKQSVRVFDHFDKREDFSFVIVNFLFLPSACIFISIYLKVDKMMFNSTVLNNSKTFQVNPTKIDTLIEEPIDR